jgi:predicted ATPase/class 3 adenylate cyclase
MSTLTTGTYTFLFTDIEGSTQRWERYPQAMHDALARHDALLHAAIAAHHGRVVKTTGDGVLAVFTSALQAMAAVLDAQRALTITAWGEVGAVRVRMALHTGEATERDGDYYAPALNRAARLLASGHGGQILLSRPTYDLVRDQLPPEAVIQDMGEHRLKDLGRPEHIFQLSAPGLENTFPALTTLQRRLHNLPVQATPLLGREEEVARLSVVLRQPETRLVTLTGPGGTGKTRLALQVAAELLEEYDDGVYFVPLAPVSDPGLVLNAMAQVLAVRELGSEPLERSLAGFLREKRLLLVLDNYEQVVVAAPLVGRLLAEAPGLRVLATSRVLLHVYGEQQYAVPPLALPPTGPGQQYDVASLSQYAAVALFIQRARLVKPDFAVSNETAPAVAGICVRLDGLPLAIELAAAQVKLLPPALLLARLSSRLAILTGGARDLPSRQQTLRGAIDWSYNLLALPEQALFARLSVFVGGWTLEAAEAVCAGNEDLAPLEGLGSLVDKSLVRQSEDQHGEPRFEILETIQEYAAERLTDVGDASAMRDRHLAYYLALAEEAAPRLSGPEQGPWLGRLELEHDNLRAALGWSLRGDDAVNSGLRLAVALWRFWETHGHLSVGRRWLEEALAASESRGAPAVLRARALNGVGNLAFREGDYAQARAWYEESLATRRALGDTHSIANSLNNLGNLATNQGEYARAGTLHEESLAIRRGLGDKQGIADSLKNLGIAARRQGDHARAGIQHQESLTLYSALGNEKGIADALYNLGLIASDQGGYARAVVLYEESLAFFRALGHTQGIASILDRVALLAQAQGQPRRATRLWGAADLLYQTIGAPREPIDQAEYEQALAQARTLLGEQAFAAAQFEGQALSLEQAITLVLARDEIS